MAITEVISHPLFLGLYLVLILLLFVVIFSGKYSLFGLAAFFKKLPGTNALVFFKMPDGNIKFPPKFHNMDKTEIEVKKKGVKKIYPINRNEFTDGKIFGFPYCIKDSDDAVRSYGLYAEDFQEVQDENGDVKYETVYETVQAQDENGKVMTVKTNMPRLTKAKGSYRVDPELIDGLISKNSILSSIKDLFQKHNLMFLGLVVVGVMILVSLYLGYENMTMLQEQILPAIDSLKGDIANKAADEGAKNVPLN